MLNPDPKQKTETFKAIVLFLIKNIEFKLSGKKNFQKIQKVNLPNRLKDDLLQIITNPNFDNKNPLKLLLYMIFLNKLVQKNRGRPKYKK